MPFPDGSQEVPCGPLVALPEFRLNPLNGRTAPMSVAPGRVAVARMQTFAPCRNAEAALSTGDNYRLEVLGTSAISSPTTRGIAGRSSARAISDYGKLDHAAE
jgi:hypothetical protein